MLQVIIEESDLKKGAGKEVKSPRHVLKSVMWFIVLTFPIWLFWFGALSVEATTHAPVEIYLILTIFSYYAILILVPFIGIPWLLIVIFLVAMEIRKMWARRRAYRVEKNGAATKNTRGVSPKAK